jgi:hypothetical protein
MQASKATKNGCFSKANAREERASAYPAGNLPEEAIRKRL